MLDDVDHVDGEDDELTVEECWSWLLGRLTSEGDEVVSARPGRIEMAEPDPEGTPYTVVVTPEEWATIAVPVGAIEVEPFDFNRQDDEDRFLVFHEGSLVWSVREELPPVSAFDRFVAARRSAEAQGEDVGGRGWFSYVPLSEADVDRPSR